MVFSRRPDNSYNECCLVLTKRSCCPVHARAWCYVERKERWEGGGEGGGGGGCEGMGEGRGREGRR